MGVQDVQEIIKSCRFCFMCRHACPTFLATKLDSHTPRGYALLLSQIAEGYRDWTPETMDRFYQCSQCGLCREDCEYHWQEDELVRHAREEIVQQNRTPERVAQIATSLIRNGTPYQDEGKASYVPQEIIGRKQVKVLYFAGCSTRHTHPALIEALAKIFRTADVQWTMLEDEGCCGTSLYELGYTEAAKTTAQTLVRKITEAAPKILLTGCPHCLRTFKEFYPQWELEFEPNMQILHTSQYLARLLTEGRLRLNGKVDLSAVCYHDPCQLGRKMQEYDAPRQLIEIVTDQAPRELFHNKALAECCGAGSVMFLTDPEISGKVAEKRLERVAETGADGIITACQNCKTMLLIAQNGAEHVVPVMDIVELVAAKIS